MNARGSGRRDGHRREADVRRAGFYGQRQYVLWRNRAGIIVRVAPEACAEALALPNADVMDFTGRPVRGWIHVESAGLASDEELHDWMARGMCFAATLPAK